MGAIETRPQPSPEIQPVSTANCCHVTLGQGHLATSNPNLKTVGHSFEINQDTVQGNKSFPKIIVENDKSQHCQRCVIFSVLTSQAWSLCHTCIPTPIKYDNLM